MTRLLRAIARRFYPGLDALPKLRQAATLGDIIMVLAAAPLALLGLIWLASQTDLELARHNLLAFIAIGLLLYIFQRLSFFIVIEIMPGRYASSSGSLDNVINWSAMLLAGPTILWMQFLSQSIKLLSEMRVDRGPEWLWNRLRNLLVNTVSVTIAPLTGLAVYRSLGGVIPFPGLDLRSVMIVLVATAAQFVVATLVWVGFAYYYARIQASANNQVIPHPFVRFLLLTFGLPGLAEPFSILAAGIYVSLGIGAYIFFLGGLLVVSLLANRLSQVAESNRQQTSMMAKLEALGRAIIDAPPDASSLPDLLKQYLPGMFTFDSLEIHMFPEQTLFAHPEEGPRASPELWCWAREQKQATLLVYHDELPWQPGARARQAMAVAPVIRPENNETIGAVYMTMQHKETQWKPSEMAAVLPGLQSLCAAIASALRQSEVYERSVAYERALQELELAGEIQERFLPQELPVIPGWQLAAMLKPARHASGDFFDLIPLSNGRIGLVVADVTDKGMGAALYMALSRTLIRTYAMEWATQPALALSAANRRILTDINANQFVTVFYGVLDPSTGRLTYCSAGHNPAFIFSAGERAPRKQLIRTGAPLGIATGMTWKQMEAQIEPGELLMLYTDGIVEAQDAGQQFYDYDRLIAAVGERPDADVEQLQQHLMDSLHAFTGEAPQYDDITLMLVARDR